MTLKNKTVLVTGATAGFGEACARLFVAQGARVVATGRREDRLAKLKKELSNPLPNPLSLKGEGGRASGAAGEGFIHTLSFDVRDKDAIDKAIKSLPKEFSEIDILINNAGGALGFSSFEQSSLDDAEAMVDANIKGLIYCTRALLPGMIKRDSGHIVNLSSVAGTYPYPGGNVYGGSKAFVTQFSLNLRADLLGKNIRVTNIEPGMAETEFALVRFHGDKEKADAVYAGMKPLSAEDIAESILWAVTRPAHVNINRLEIMPTQQAFGAFAVNRKN